MGEPATLIYEGKDLTITYSQTVGLYHVFIRGAKPKSFPTIDYVQEYIYDKMGQVIQFVTEARQ